MNAFEKIWESVERRVQLPTDCIDFFEFRGPIKGQYSDRRRYQRYFLRGRAILERDGALYGVFTKDISRSGMVVLFYEQLFPNDEVKVILPDGKKLRLQVRRCRRVDDDCYECGCEIQV